MASHQSRTGRALNVAVAASLALLLCFGLIFLLVKRGADLPTEEQRGHQSAQSDSSSESVASDQQKDSAASATAKGVSPPPLASTENAAEPVAKKTRGDEAPRCVVSGVVRVVETGAPAAGVEIVLRAEVPAVDGQKFTERFKVPRVKEGDQHATSGADGTYRVEDLPAGDYRVFALRGETEFVSIPPASGKRLRLTEDAPHRTLDVEVTLGGVFFGKVIDRDEKPVPGAKVSAISRDVLSAAFDPDSEFLGVPEVVSKDDGSYRIAGLPQETKYLVVGNAESFTKTVSEEIAFSDEEREIELDLVLLEGSSVAGVVLSAEGQPLSGVSVRMVRTDATELFSMEQPGGTETEDGTGAFLFERLAAGKYALTAELSGWQPVTQTVECDGESAISDRILRFEVTSAGAEKGGLRGRVTDDLGAGLEGVSLKLSGFVPGSGARNLTASSEADGSFAFQIASQGVFNLEVEHEGYAPHIATGLRPDAGPLEVVLKRLATVSGVVVSLASGEPVAGAVVKPVYADSEIRFDRLMAGLIQGGAASSKATADGTFVLPNVNPGRLRVRAEASGFGPSFSRELEVGPGEEIQGVQVALSEGGSLRGVVLTPEGLPVGYASVRAHEISGNSLEEYMRRMMPTMLGGASAPSAKTEDDGIFGIDHLPAGKFALNATHPEFAPSVDVELVLQPDETRDGIQLRLRRPSTIRVLAREKEKPLTGLMVQLLGGGPMKMGTSDSEGRFSFQGVGPGDYLVQLLDMARMMSGQGLGLRQRAVSVGEGEVLDVEFRFGTGAKVHGKVEGDVPGGMAMVLLRRPEGPNPEDMDPMDFPASIRASKHNVGMGFIRPDKTYSIPDVPDGEFIVEIPRMPGDFTKLAQMSPEERKPLYRETVKVRNGRDLEWNIKIPTPTASTQ